jgi:predicted transcriptional regulator
MLSPQTEQLRNYRRTKLQRRPMERAMYLFEYRLFSCLQEPKNKTQIGLHVFIEFNLLSETLSKYQRLGIIQIVELSPNKFMLTRKGRQVLYLIKELNKLLGKWVTIDLDHA